MGRTRVRRRRLVAIVLLVGTLGISGPVANAVARGDGAARPARTHVIRPGDTLWAIARRVAPAVDPRIVVDAIASANELDPGALVPGQELAIPALA